MAIPSAKPKACPAIGEKSVGKRMRWNDFKI
jgi:hypothetical protein